MSKFRNEIENIVLHVFLSNVIQASETLVGIIRNDKCVNITKWQAYRCYGLQHEMLVIESMDGDTGKLLTVKMCMENELLFLRCTSCF